MPEVRISSADATASHRHNAPGSTPGCSHTTDAGPPLYASSYTTPDGTLSVGLLLSDQVQKIARKTNTSSPRMSSSFIELKRIILYWVREGYLKTGLERNN